MKTTCTPLSGYDKMSNPSSENIHIVYQTKERY